MFLYLKKPVHKKLGLNLKDFQGYQNFAKNSLRKSERYPNILSKIYFGYVRKCSITVYVFSLSHQLSCNCFSFHLFVFRGHWFPHYLCIFCLMNAVERGEGNIVPRKIP